MLQVDVSDGSRGGFVVSCLSCFGGGVILTTALTHMLPEVNLFLQYNIQQGQLIDRVRIFKLDQVHLACRTQLWNLRNSGKAKILWCITSGASPLVHHLWCISLLWCINSDASTLVHHLWCTASGASPLVGEKPRKSVRNGENQ